MSHCTGSKCNCGADEKKKRGKSFNIKGLAIKYWALLTLKRLDMYSVFLYLSMVSLTWCGGELFTSESALKSSPLWNNEEPLLISLKGTL